MLRDILLLRRRVAILCDCVQQPVNVFVMNKISDGSRYLALLADDVGIKETNCGELPTLKVGLLVCRICFTCYVGLREDRLKNLHRYEISRVRHKPQMLDPNREASQPPRMVCISTSSATSVPGIVGRQTSDRSHS